MTFKKALLAATMLALPLAAQAQPITGIYVGAGFGFNFMQNSDVELRGQAATGLTNAQRNGNLDWQWGWAMLGSVGYGFGNGLRVEAEGSWRENQADGVSGFSSGGTRPNNVTGTARSYGLMANVVYDIDLGPGMGFMPYIGGGAGYIWTDYDSVNITTNGVRTLSLTGTDGRFAYQAIVGAAVPVPQLLPGLYLTAEYRFLGTVMPQVNASSPAGFRGSADTDNFNQSIMFGVRYAFNTAPPPPPAATPAAAPAPARSFLVFFDWDRADLSDRARQIIAEAAQSARTQQVTRIEVSGHADRTGSAQYNMQLSMRRAQNVAAELERRGVARSQMTLQAFGDTRPLVPTGPNVREPQNRRVEIVLR
jgi:outer membrane protein OmpA-like peptidoglycan-associated protein